MNRQPKTTRQILEMLFADYSGRNERDEIAKNIVASTADQIAMIAGALDDDEHDPHVGAARACLLRLEDQLRFALEFDFGSLEADEKPESDDATAEETGVVS